MDLVVVMDAAAVVAGISEVRAVMAPAADTSVVPVAGKVDISVAPAVRAAVTRIMAVVDISGGTPGLRVNIRELPVAAPQLLAVARLKMRRPRLQISINPQPKPNQIMTITGEGNFV